MTEPDAELQVRLTDRGGGIGKLVWRLNGAPLAVTGSAAQRGLGVVASNTSADAKPTRTVTQSLTLTPGRNTIELVERFVSS